MTDKGRQIELTSNDIYDQLNEFKETYNKDLTAMKTRLLNQSKKLDAFTKRTSVFTNKNAELMKYIESVDPDMVREKLSEVESKISGVRKKSQSMILRMTVATEVAYYLRKHENKAQQAALTIINLFDESDDWWKSKENLTLKEWAAFLK